MIWSPDSNLFGPVPELKTIFCNGIIPGFSQSGGMGLLRYNWIIQGETNYDMFVGHSSFGSWQVKSSLNLELVINMPIDLVFFPNEERAAGRPVQFWPFTNYRKNGRNGSQLWLEHPLWFANKPGGRYKWFNSLKNWFEPVGKECV